MQQRHRLRQGPPGPAAAPATTHQRRVSVRLGWLRCDPLQVNSVLFAAAAAESVERDRLPPR